MAEKGAVAWGVDHSANSGFELSSSGSCAFGTERSAQPAAKAEKIISKSVFFILFRIIGFFIDMHLFSPRHSPNEFGSALGLSKTLIFFIAEKCADKFAAVEPAQVVDPLADADVAHRNAEPVADADDDAPLGRAV